MPVLERPLHSEHRLKNTWQLIQRSLRQTPQSLDEMSPIHSSQLISHNMTIFPIKSVSHTTRLWMAASFQRRNHESAKESIRLIRRHDDTRSERPDFRSSRWVQHNRKDLPS